MNDKGEREKSHLEQRLIALEALYIRFGRDGLKDQPLQDVNMLLTSKQLQFRDAPKGNVSDEQRANNQLLEMQILDLKAHVNAQAASIGLSNRPYGEYLQAKSMPHQSKGKEPDKGRER